MVRRLAVVGAASLAALALLVTIVGYALPRGHVAAAEAIVAKPRDEVFRRISDVSRYPEWRPDVSRVEILSTAPLRWREHTGSDIVTYEVAESIAPHRLVVRIADPDLPFGGTWTYELSAAPEGTRVVIIERGEVYNPIFRFVSRFFLSPTATMERVLDALGARDGQNLTPSEK